jgi:hypothetical protein
VNPTRPTVAVVATTIVLALAACGGSSGSKADTGKKKPVASTTTTTKAPPTAPLTGLPDPDGAAQGRSVLSIKIDNDSSLARPQTGIESADIVWDEVVEGEGTRFLAMFQSQVPDVVGPVRSVRLTDPLIVWPVGGVFAYSGGAKYAVDSINQAPVVRIDESAAGDGMFRDSSRRPPHNLYAKPPVLFIKGGQPVPPPALFDYAADAGATGGTASAVHIAFSNQEFAPTYTWDAASGTWKRSTRAGAFMAKSGTQIAPKNVVVLPVVYGGTGLGNIGAEAQLVGNGTVQVFTNGHVVTGTWTRPDKATPMKLVDAAGKPITLSPGTTWVELPDVSYPVQVTP